MPRTRFTGLLLCLGLLFLLGSPGTYTQLSAKEKKAQPHDEYGMAYFYDERDQEALIDCKNIIHLDPQDANADHQQAFMHLKLDGRPDLRAVFGELSKGGRDSFLYSRGPIEI
jgi:hypothetical protein